MGRFANDWPIFDQIVDVIAGRMDDFDRETIEDLIEAVSPEELWELAVGPMIDKIMERLGLQPASNKLGGAQVNLPPKDREDSRDPASAGAVTIKRLPIEGECPNCGARFASRPPHRVTCTNCNKKVLATLVTTKGAP